MAGPKFSNTLPLLIWLIVLGLIAILGADLTAFAFFPAIMWALGLFLLIPVLGDLDIAPKSIIWFQKAGLIAIMAAAFGFISYIGFIAVSDWYLIFMGVFLAVSLLFTFIGALIGFLKWK